jgi:DNA excision repair protein ERCC-6
MAVKVHRFCFTVELYNIKGNGSKIFLLACFNCGPGIQTAMRHDTIMEGGYADYALVEGEARRVANEAVQALKESRRQCWQADTGVPSWTGQSGALRSHNISATQAR